MVASYHYRLNSSEMPELCHPLASNYTSIVHRDRHIICSAPFFLSPKYLSNKSPTIKKKNWNLKFYFLVWTRFLSDLWPVLGCPKFWFMWKDWVSHLKTWGAWSSEHFLFTPCFSVLECFVFFVNQPFQLKYCPSQILNSWAHFFLWEIPWVNILSLWRGILYCTH